MMGYIVGLLITTGVLAIPLSAIVLSYKDKAQKNKLRELELQKEMLQLEIEKQNGKLKLLESENKKYDAIIEDLSGGGVKGGQLF